MSLRSGVKFYEKYGAIFLHDYITHISALVIEKHLQRLDKEKTEKPIWFIIRSPGGDFYATLKIAAALRTCRRPIGTVIYGKAFSGGLLLSQSGATRLATRNSTLRFHQAVHTFPQDVQMNAAKLEEHAHELLRIDAMQLQVYSIKVRPIKELHSLFKGESYFGAGLAKRIHLVDGVIAKPKSIWHLLRSLP